MATTPAITVVLKAVDVRTRIDTHDTTNISTSDRRHESWWWTVIRQDSYEEQDVEVTRGEWLNHEIGSTFDLQEYPGSNRLVQGTKYGGRVKYLEMTGAIVLLLALVWGLGIVFDN